MNTTPEDDGDEQAGQDDEGFDTDLSAAEAGQLALGVLPQVPGGTRHLGQDAGHDQQADPVANPVLVNLLAQPHQEDRPAGHGQHGADLPTEIQIIGRGTEKSVVDQRGAGRSSRHP